MMILTRKIVNVAAKTFSAFPKYENIFEKYAVLPLHKIIKKIVFPESQISSNSKIIRVETMPRVTKLLIAAAMKSLFPNHQVVSINSSTLKRAVKVRSKKAITLRQSSIKRFTIKFNQDIDMLKEAKDIITS